MGCIKNQYRKMMQNVDAIKRQQEANPSAFKIQQDDQVRAASAAESIRPDDKEDAKVDDNLGEDCDDNADAESKKEPEEKKKREAIDKQQAYLEFKDSEEGQVL